MLCSFHLVCSSDHSCR